MQQQLPVSFDWRTRSHITPVQNQGQCGCCWAWAATQMLADRLRIAGMSSTPVLSAEYTKDCSTVALASKYEALMSPPLPSNIGECAVGGVLAMACEFLEKYGAPSSQSVPYASATFDGHDVGVCQKTSSRLYTAEVGSLAVVTLGPNGHGPASHEDVVNARLSPEVIARNVKEMQWNIMQYGPIGVSMVVYKDLVDANFNNPGVYIPNVQSGIDGGHAVTIVGWGVQAGRLPYWIVRNSWGPAWNGDGYFRIVRGQNASSIESAAISLRPQTNPKVTGQLVYGSSEPASEASAAQKWGIAAGVIGGVILLLVASIIALAVYGKDKGWNW